MAFGCQATLLTEALLLDFSLNEKSRLSSGIFDNKQKHVIYTA